VAGVTGLPQIAAGGIMESRQVRAVLAAGATDVEIIELDGPSRSLEVRYHFPSRQVFERYEKEHAARLRAEGLLRFPAERGISYRRSVGLVVEKE